MNARTASLKCGRCIASLNSTTSRFMIELDAALEQVRPRLALDRRERLGRVEGYLGGGLDRGVEQLVCGKHLVHEPDAPRFRRVDDPARQHQLHRLPEADDVYEDALLASSGNTPTRTKRIDRRARSEA